MLRRSAAGDEDRVSVARVVTVAIAVVRGMTMGGRKRIGSHNDTNWERELIEDAQMTM